MVSRNSYLPVPGQEIRPPAPPRPPLPPFQVLRYMISTSICPAKPSNTPSAIALARITHTIHRSYLSKLPDYLSPSPELSPAIVVSSEAR